MLLDWQQIRCASYIYHLSSRRNGQWSDSPDNSYLCAARSLAQSGREEASCSIIQGSLSSWIKSTKSMRSPTIESLAWEPSWLSYQIYLLRWSRSAISRRHYPSWSIDIIVGKIDPCELMRCAKVW